MLTKRFWMPLLVLSGLVVSVMPFQNCSSAPKIKRAEFDALKFNEVSSREQIQFHQAKWVASDDATALGIEGFCSRERNGSRISWALQSDDIADNALDSGQATCRDGAFEFQVSLNDDMICGLDHVVVIKTEWGPAVQTVVAKRCQPLASERLPASLGSTEGQCELNYNLKTSSPGERECAKVCYQSGKLISEEVRPVQECQHLASTLAGQ